MFKNFNKIFNKKNEFIISTHVFPDGDGLGSIYALYHALKQKKFKVKIFTDNIILPLPFKIVNSRINKVTKNSYLIIVDANTISKIPKKILNLKIPTSNYIFIDHHIPELKIINSKYYIDPLASSTGELIYTLLNKNFKIKFNKDIATGIYTALVSDTRSFKYSRTTALSHKIAYLFIKNNLIHPEEIQNKLFDTKSPQYLKFIGYILSNFKISKKIAYILIDKQILKKYKIKKYFLKSSYNILFSATDINTIMLIYKTSKTAEFFIKSKIILNYNMFLKFNPCIKKYSCTFKLINRNNSFIKNLEKILDK